MAGRVVSIEGDAGGRAHLSTGVAARARRSIPSRRTGVEGSRAAGACGYGGRLGPSRHQPFTVSVA